MRLNAIVFIRGHNASARAAEETFVCRCPRDSNLGWSSKKRKKYSKMKGKKLDESLDFVQNISFHRPRIEYFASFSKRKIIPGRDQVVTKEKIRVTREKRRCVSLPEADSSIRLPTSLLRMPRDCWGWLVEGCVPSTDGMVNEEFSTIFSISPIPLPKHVLLVFRSRILALLVGGKGGKIGRSKNSPSHCNYIRKGLIQTSTRGSTSTRG